MVPWTGGPLERPHPGPRSSVLSSCPTSFLPPCSFKGSSISRVSGPDGTPARSHPALRQDTERPPSNATQTEATKLVQARGRGLTGACLRSPDFFLQPQIKPALPSPPTVEGWGLGMCSSCFTLKCFTFFDTDLNLSLCDCDRGVIVV